MAAHCKLCGFAHLFPHNKFGCNRLRMFIWRTTSGAGRAIALVNNAVRRGKIPKAKTLTCADCSKPAHDYDHRDYNKPLEIVPVCRRCNLLRGPAIWRTGCEA